jgi:hypothetical protein
MGSSCLGTNGCNILSGLERAVWADLESGLGSVGLVSEKSKEMG